MWLFISDRNCNWEKLSLVYELVIFSLVGSFYVYSFLSHLLGLRH